MYYYYDLHLVWRGHGLWNSQSLISFPNKIFLIFIFVLCKFIKPIDVYFKTRKKEKEVVSAWIENREEFVAVTWWWRQALTILKGMKEDQTLWFDEFSKKR